MANLRTAQLGLVLMTAASCSSLPVGDPCGDGGGCQALNYICDVRPPAGYCTMPCAVEGEQCWIGDSAGAICMRFAPDGGLQCARDCSLIPGARAATCPASSTCRSIPDGGASGCTFP